MFTWRILIYLAALAGAAAFRVSYIGWFGVMLFWAVALLPALLALISLPSMLLAKCSLSSPLSARRDAGASASLCLRLRSLLPLSALRAKVNIINLYTGDSTGLRLALGGTGSADAGFSLPTSGCGRLEISARGLWCYDLLCLLRLPCHRPESAFCTILPCDTAPANAPDIESALESDKSLTPKPGGGYSEDHELRDYRPGDPMRAMHWKLSSKMDSPIIREPLVNTDKAVLVLLDPSGDIQRSLDSLCWLCNKLCALETPHTVIWSSASGRHSFDISSPGDATAMFDELLSAPSSAPPAVDMSGVRRLFTVKNGEVRFS